MGLRVNTNIPSMTAQNNLARTTDKLSRIFTRLSTGTRIARASDDAAGLAISERLRNRIASQNQAQRNAQDGISLVQVADSALGEVQDILIRMRELAVQSANGTVSSADKDTLQDEFAALTEEVDRIAGQTNYNRIPLLNGGTSTLTFHVGADTTANVDTLTISLVDVLTSTMSISASDISIGSAGNQISAISAIDSAVDIVSGARGDLGAVQSRLEGLISQLAVSAENLSAAESRIRDVDVAAESAELTRYSILQQASISVLSQANVQPQAALALLQN